jgi:cytochrome c
MRRRCSISFAARPATAPRSLTDQEVYQLTAYVLFLNKLVANDTVDKTRPKVKMPNAGNFIIASRKDLAPRIHPSTSLG